MKYCYNCHRVTTGDPIYCASCGRTYNIKICSHGHPNGRSVTFCSQCGTGQFSVPQPIVPLWLRPLLFFVRMLPVLALVITSVVLILGIWHHVVTNPAIQIRLIYVAVVFCIFWFCWRKLPLGLRRGIRTLLTWMPTKRKQGRH
jgi:hypothetical protein